MAKRDLTPEQREHEIELMMEEMGLSRERAEYLFAIENEEGGGDVIEVDSDE